MMTHRKEIERFCLQLFNHVAADDNINRLRRVIINYKHLRKFLSPSGIETHRQVSQPFSQLAKLVDNLQF